MYESKTDQIIRRNKEYFESFEKEILQQDGRLRELIQNSRSFICETFPIIPKEEEPENSNPSTEMDPQKIAEWIKNSFNDLEPTNEFQFEVFRKMLLTAKTRKDVVRILNSFRKFFNEDPLFKLSRKEGYEENQENYDESIIRSYKQLQPKFLEMVKSGRNADIVRLIGKKTLLDSKVYFDFDLKDYLENPFVMMANIPRPNPYKIGEFIEGKQDHPAMMTEEKLLHFLQLPQLPYWIKEHGEPTQKYHHFCSNLTLYTEYFAENPHLMNQQEIHLEDLEEWMVKKIEKYDPDYRVSLYLFGRLMWTDGYEIACKHIEPQLKKHLIKECKLIESHEKEKFQSDNMNYFDVMDQLILKLENVESNLAEKIKEILPFLLPYHFLPSLPPNLTDERPNYQWTQDGSISYNTNRALKQKLLSAQNWKIRIEPLILKATKEMKTFEEWLAFKKEFEHTFERRHYSYEDFTKAIEGFPHFSETLFFEFCIQMRSLQDLDLEENYTNELYSILETMSMNELKLFGKRLKNNAFGLDKFSIVELKKQIEEKPYETYAEWSERSLEYVKEFQLWEIKASLEYYLHKRLSYWNLEINRVFDEIYLKRIKGGTIDLKEFTDEQLIQVVDNPHTYKIDTPDTDFNTEITPYILRREACQPSSVAEAVLLKRYLEKTREGKGLVNYLLQHQNQIKSIDLILPFSDAVNPLVIQEYKDHPDLFALLQITTILQYLGYENHLVLKEVAFHAEQAELMHHPKMNPVGIELEQTNYLGQTIHSKYSWLTNVMIKGGDWLSSNEITSAPTHSPYLQTILLALISKPEFGFLDHQKIWLNQKEGIQTNSIHVNLAFNKKTDLLSRYAMDELEPLSNAVMIAYGSDIIFSGSSLSQTPLGELGFSDSTWKYSSSLLDSQNTLAKRQRYEEKSGRLSEVGHHEDLIESVWAIGNAGLHYFNLCQQSTSFDGGFFEQQLGVMYHQFCQELNLIFDKSQPLNSVNRQLGFQISDQIKAILKKYTSLIKQEVRSSVKPAHFGGRIISPYRL